MWLKDSIAPPSALSVVVDTYIHKNEPNLVGICVIAIAIQRQHSGQGCLRDCITPPSALFVVVDTHIHENEPNLVGLCVIAIDSQR